MKRYGGYRYKLQNDSIENVTMFTILFNDIVAFVALWISHEVRYIGDAIVTYKSLTVISRNSLFIEKHAKSKKILVNKILVKILYIF